MATIFYDGQLREIEHYPLVLQDKSGDIVIVASADRVLHVVQFERDPRIIVYSSGVWAESDGLHTVNQSEAVNIILFNFNKSMGLWTEAMNAAGVKPRKPENLPIGKQVVDKMFDALGFGKDLDNE